MFPPEAALMQQICCPCCGHGLQSSEANRVIDVPPTGWRGLSERVAKALSRVDFASGRRRAIATFQVLILCGLAAVEIFVFAA
jgi:hypothetical protein